MNRVLSRLLVAAMAASALATLFMAAPVAAKTHHHKAPPYNFHATLTGQVPYFSPAGFEPDFDLINRAIILTHAHTRKGLPLTLILDAYLENFQTDTQPVLPDLIHPKKFLSTTLGGFFSGKAIVVGPSGQILFVGGMLAEALIKPICLYATGKPPAACKSEVQHLIVSMVGQGAAKGGHMSLRSSFVMNRKFHITSGSLYGTSDIPMKAVYQMEKGAGNLGVNQILKDFQVPRPYQRGTAGTGRPSEGICLAGHHCTNQTTSTPTTTPGTNTSATVSSRPAWMEPLGISLIGLALVLLVVYFWQGRKQKSNLRPAESEPRPPS